MRWLALGFLVLATIVGSAGVFRAFTSQLVDVTAIVRVPLHNGVVPDPAITQETVDSITSGYGLFGCSPGDVTSPIQVETGKCNWWVLRLVATNVLDSPIEDVLVENRFGPEFEATVLTSSQGQVGTYTGGEQTEVRWCVTELLQGTGCQAGGRLVPGEGAFVETLVFTKLTSQGDQNLIQTGVYEMNSEATVSFIDTATGELLSSGAPPIQLEALDADGGESTLTTAPTPAPTATPVATPESAPVPTPTSTPMPTPMIEEIKEREDDSGVVAMMRQSVFKKGAPMRVLGGPMANFLGIFDGASDEERVFILLELLGRQVRVHIPVEMVAAEI